MFEFFVVLKKHPNRPGPGLTRPSLKKKNTIDDRKAQLLVGKSTVVCSS